MGIPETEYRFHEHDKLAHYANAAFDIEFNFPIGFKELEGIHSRTDFDLASHQKYSGKKIQYFDPELNEAMYLMLWKLLSGSTGLSFGLKLCLPGRKIRRRSDRVVMKFPVFSSNQSGCFTIVKKDGLPERVWKFLTS